jgi:nitrate reductase NapAB chaperone NapD
MVVQPIREFNRAVPFQPYEIQMVSGECYEVPHPEFIAVSPKGTFVVVLDAKDRPHHLYSKLVERVSLQKTRRRGKTGKH